MQIDKRYKIEKAVSKDPSREHLQNIWVTKHHAFATNGIILAAVPVQQTRTIPKAGLTTDALKFGRKCSVGDIMQIELNGSQKLSDGTMLLRPTDHKFPHISSILLKSHRKRSYRIGINIDQLKNLADALGSDEVILELASTPNEPILVRPAAKGCGSQGLAHADSFESVNHIHHRWKEYLWRII